MAEQSTAAPTEEELHELRKDAQEGVAGARAALQGDIDALTAWRETRQSPSTE
jgi:hypothetical protein